ncbi:hypothetical protein JDV02_002292 [Purpureocillium takamizusanense]|uniref:Phytanoyl-CoA dioxygenase n=1 Tax=Purpureocillium takamizusanense TaxID=2060973 RepID=A0A9Q8QAP9_9HYPO|nr:uncharacterized protein JDV02_002292 [Purpureocillium takamizusanense]UNI15791.1 hypothetical protein JDV02_002292 [Purpureocillium takamizusanense]
MAGLTPEQLASFDRDGYLIVPGALRPDTVVGLLAETRRLLSSFSLADHPLTRFSTGEKSDHVGDDYFLTSGDKVRFFFEEDAFDDAGNLTKDKERAVNKIGHALHTLSPPFKALLLPDDDDDDQREQAQQQQQQVSPAAVARSLGFRDPRCLQSMVICKQPEIGGAVPPHQDSTFLYTDPPSAVGFWYALEDATLENGCLSFLPGSHRWAPVEKRLVRRSPAGSSSGGAGGTEMVDNDGPRFPSSREEEERTKPDGVVGGDDAAAYVPGEVKAGDLVLIHGNLLHKSERNTSQKGRIIYTFHIIEWEGTRYDKRNWLQPPAEGFTRLYA